MCTHHLDSGRASAFFCEHVALVGYVSLLGIAG